MTWRFWVWRCIYGLMLLPVFTSTIAALLNAYARLRGHERAEALLGRLEMTIAYSGWPHHERGWINLHGSRWIADLRRARSRRAVALAEPPRPVRRIGCVGRFSGLLGFPKQLMAACPAELVIADIGYAGRHAPALRDVAAAYEAFDFDAANRLSHEIDRLAAFLRAQQVDLLINIGAKQDAAALLDVVDVPCVANLCAGSDLFHHPRVDIQLHGQPEADYFVRDSRMFCGTTAGWFSDQYVHDLTGFMDARGLALESGAPWSSREPLIVCHGSMYKFARPQFLDVICRLLAEDSSLRLVCIGKDDGGAVATILEHAARWNVAGRAEYLGEFSAMRNDAGEVTDPGWRTLIDLLRRARLAPNPFPLGGGSARFEAYILGTPTVHLGVRFDRESWGRPQPSTCEIPSLLTRAGTAWSIEEYGALARKCLGDGAFADVLAAEQLSRARIIADAPRWWRDVLDGHRQWLSSKLERRQA